MDDKCQHCNDNGYVLLAFSREVCDQCHGTGTAAPVFLDGPPVHGQGHWHEHSPAESDLREWVGRGVRASNNPWAQAYKRHGTAGIRLDHKALQARRAEDAILRAIAGGQIERLLKIEAEDLVIENPRAGIRLTLKPGEQIEDAINRAIAESQIEAQQKRQAAGQRVIGTFRYGGGGEVSLKGSLISVEQDRPDASVVGPSGSVAYSSVCYGTSAKVVIKEAGASETELLSALAELRDTGTLALMDLSGATIVTADHAFIEKGDFPRQWIFHCRGVQYGGSR